MGDTTTRTSDLAETDADRVGDVFFRIEEEE